MKTEFRVHVYFPHNTFDQWKAEVDYYVSAMVGLTSDCLPDCPYRDWYEDGEYAYTAARRAIKRAENG
jgi:hypothetical protein